MRVTLLLVGCWALAAMVAAAPAPAQLSGHGGPVRAIAVAPDGATALSGSFDGSAILWSLQRGVALQVLRYHGGAVNAVTLLPDGRAVTGGEEGRIALWKRGEQKPAAVLEGHQGPISALAVSPDGQWLASGSWDRTVRLWPLAGGSPRVLEGHQQSVNGLAFATDGAALVSVGYDATMRLWPLRDGEAPRVMTLPVPLNAVAVARDGEIVAGGADGKLYFLGATGDEQGTLNVSATPVTALAIDARASGIAAGSVGGTIVLVERAARAVVRTFAETGTPVWAAAFLPDGHSLLTGGADHLIRRWDVQTGKLLGATAAGEPADPLAAYAGDPGAQVFRACVACHALTPDAGNRAGPSLHGLFGRRIASLPGYDFSPALKRLDIVWTPETLSKLFEIGPARYTPGTKMPEQNIGSPDDRAALIRFLERATQ
jgi:cytochrome c